MIGRAFYVMDFVDGRVLWDQSLPGMTPAERHAIYTEMNRVIAALHRVDYRAIGLDDFGKPGNYFARQIGRWSKQYKASETEQIDAMDRLIDWLPAHIPPDDGAAVNGPAIVHGDYRLDNLIFHPTEPRILAILDWELSTIGHPLADFSYHLMSWHITPTGFRGIAGLDLPALGIPTQAEYIGMYCAATGRHGIADVDFYLAYNMFRNRRHPAGHHEAGGRRDRRECAGGRRPAPARGRWPSSAGRMHSASDPDVQLCEIVALSTISTLAGTP